MGLNDFLADTTTRARKRARWQRVLAAKPDDHPERERRLYGEASQWARSCAAAFPLPLPGGAGWVARPGHFQPRLNIRSVPPAEGVLHTALRRHGGRHHGEVRPCKGRRAQRSTTALYCTLRSRVTATRSGSRRPVSSLRARSRNQVGAPSMPRDRRRIEVWGGSSPEQRHDEQESTALAGLF